MKMIRVLILLPAPLKAKLDAMRKEGYSITGFIRFAIEQELERGAK